MYTFQRSVALVVADEMTLRVEGSGQAISGTTTNRYFGHRIAGARARFLQQLDEIRLVRLETRVWAGSRIRLGSFEFRVIDTDCLLMLCTF